MELTVLNTNFEKIYILDSYESLIWVDKFAEPGTFELYTTFTPKILDFVKPSYYLQNGDSEHVMIVEDTSIESDSEKGDHIKIVGRSLESILDRRIVWKETKFDNYNLQDAVHKLIYDAITSPSIADRRIDNFFVTSASDTKITKLKITKQYKGDSLLDAISTICSENKIGYKITLTDDFQFEFQLYVGEDRSYRQNQNPFVVFSPSFDNLIESNYSDKTSGLKNVALVVGDSTKVVGANSGLSRRELYVDAGDIDKGSLSNAKYMALLEKRGTEKLSEANARRSFDGKCETSRLYVYDEDFFLGDIVQIQNEYGIESSATVTEFTWNYSTSGNDTYPTFTPVEGGVATGKNKLATTLDILQELNTSGEWSANVYVVSGLTITANEGYDGRITGITVDGKASAQVTFYVGEIEADSSDLLLSGCTDGSDSTYYLEQYDKTSSTAGVKNYSGDTSIATITLTHVNTIRFIMKSGKTVDMLTLYPMVRYITEDSGFEPYDPSQEVNS